MSCNVRELTDKYEYCPLHAWLILYCRGVTKSSNSYSRRPCQPPTPLVTHPAPLSFENNLGIHICATIIEIWAHTHEKDMGVERLQLKQLLKQKFL